MDYAHAPNNLSKSQFEDAAVSLFQIKKKGPNISQLGSRRFRFAPDSLKRAVRIAKKQMALFTLVGRKGRVANFRVFPQFPKI